MRQIITEGERPLIWKCRINGSPRPIPYIWQYEIPLLIERLPNPNDPRIEIQAVRYSAVSGSVRWPTQITAVFEPMQYNEAYFSLLLPMGKDIIHRLEESRSGSSAVSITLHLNLVFREVIEHSDDTVLFGRTRMLGTAHSTSNQETITLIRPRDEWNSDLSTWGWGEASLFEVRIRKGHQTSFLNKALEHMEEAQRAFTDGHWPTVVVEVRKAFESARGPSSSFGDLLRAILPDDKDSNRRDALDKILRGLGQLRNEAAHASESPVLRDEAELAITLGLAVLRYAGHKLTRPIV